MTDSARVRVTVGLNPNLGGFNRACQASVPLFDTENIPLFFSWKCEENSVSGEFFHHDVQL